MKVVDVMERGLGGVIGMVVFVALLLGLLLVCVCVVGSVG